MKAEFISTDLGNVFDFIAKGVRGKKARDKARALLVFDDDGISVQCNELSANCEAQVSESGKYSLNPFIFKPFLETYGKSRVVLEIDGEGIRIGRLRVAHSRVNGSFNEPNKAIESWEHFRRKQLDKRQERIKKDAQAE